MIIMLITRIRADAMQKTVRRALAPKFLRTALARAHLAFPAAPPTEDADGRCFFSYESQP